MTYRQERSSSGAGLPILIGLVLVISGARFARATLLPSAWFASLMGPPNQIGLHDNPGADKPRGPWR